MKHTPSHAKLYGKSPVLTCKVCGAKHGGVKSIRVCPDCYSKGHR